MRSEAEQVKFSPLGTHFAVLFPKKIQIYSLNLRLLDTVTTTSRFHSCLFASPPSSKASQFDDLGEADLLLMGTEKGIVEVYRVSIGHGGLAEEDSEEKEDADGVDDSGAKVEKLGVLVGHKNRSVALPIVTDFVLMEYIHSESNQYRPCPSFYPLALPENHTRQSSSHQSLPTVSSTSTTLHHSSVSTSRTQAKTERLHRSPHTTRREAALLVFS